MTRQLSKIRPTRRFLVYGAAILLGVFAVLEGARHLILGLPEDFFLWHLFFLAGITLLMGALFLPMGLTRQVLVCGSGILFLSFTVLQAVQYLGFGLSSELMLWHQLYVAGFALLLLGPLGWFLRFRVLRPIARLTEANRRVYTHIDGPHSRIPIDSQRKIGLIARERRPHLTNAVVGDAFISDQAWARREGMVAFAGYPLVTEGRLVGVVGMFARQALADFTLDALASVSEGIALGIERKRAGEALRESQAQYRDLFENVPIGIYRTTEDGRVLIANPALVHMLGYASFEELARRNLEEEGFEPDYPRDQFKELLERTGEVRGLESAWKRRDNTVLFVRENAKAVRGTDGGILYYEGTVEDITERRQAEEERALLGLAVEQATESIVITDPKGTIVYVNPAFEKVTGYSRVEVIGQNPRILKSGRQGAAFYRRMWEALTRGEVWSGHFANRRKDGSLYEEEAIISPVRDAAGKVINYVAVKRDVTQEVALEARLRQAQKMEAIGTLAGGIAHDFNNLLTPILGNADLMALDAPDALRPCIEDVKTAALRAAGLVRQLLLFSRQNPSAPQPIQIAPIVKETARLLRQSIDRRIEVNVQVPDDMWRVEADATEIQQVVMNLCVNARDAIQDCLEGRVEKPGHRVDRSFHIAIKADQVFIDQAYSERHPDARAGAFVRLRVSDDGTGMDEGTQRRIFDPFFTTKGLGRGTGLGLATVYGIVEQRHGWIEVRSVLGEGSLFSVYLPRCEGEAGVEGDGVPAEPIRGGTETVLVVDDEESSCVLAERVLQQYGYAVMLARDGMEALRVYARASDQVDLVLLDLNMSVLSGWEVLQRLRALGARVPVLLCSGYVTEGAGEEFKKIGAAGFISKPYTMDRLALAVRRALDGRVRP